MTRNQYLRQMAELEAKLGPDKSRLHHEFANGWSVVAPKTQRDIKRVGTLMGHCWQTGFTGTGDPYVLRDPDQIPRVAWNITVPHMANDGYTPSGLPPGQQVFAGGTHAPSGHNSAPPKPEHWDMLREWAQAQSPPVKMWHYTGGQNPQFTSQYDLGEPGPNPYFDQATQSFIPKPEAARPLAKTTSWWEAQPENEQPEFDGADDLTGVFDMVCPTCHGGVPGRTPDPGSRLGWRPCPSCGAIDHNPEIELNGPVRGGDGGAYVPKKLEPEWMTLPPVSEGQVGSPRQGGTDLANAASVTAATASLVDAINALRPQMAAEAQKVYDQWQPDNEFDDWGSGGICDSIAQELGGVIAQTIPDVEIREGGWEGDDHAYVIAALNGEEVVVDIPARTYEMGGGYSWEKIPGVRFMPDYVDVYAL